MVLVHKAMRLTVHEVSSFGVHDVMRLHTKSSEQKYRLSLFCIQEFEALYRTLVVGDWWVQASFTPRILKIRISWAIFLATT
ncbi:hypothetical protein CIK74_01380 [Glutamicibacter sp. BW77]|nr:hypothetical protein CIK74_01380 [Glutamicibacter sp. BW77]